MSIKVIRETHSTPRWASRILELAAGFNLRGDPLYRLIWGQNRLDWVGGKWANGAIELRQIPRYSHLGVNKFFVERWYPPSHFGSRDQWEKQTIERVDGISIPALGPYPANGDYDHFYTMEGPDGKFRQLTPNRVRWIAAIIVDSEAANKREMFYRDKVLREQQEAETDATDLAMLKEAQRPFGNEPMVNVL